MSDPAIVKQSGHSFSYGASLTPSVSPNPPLSKLSNNNTSLFEKAHDGYCYPNCPVISFPALPR